MSSKISTELRKRRLLFIIKGLRSLRLPLFGLTNQSYSFLSYLSLFMIALPLLLLLFPYRTSTGSKSFLLYTFHKRFSSHCPLTDTVNVSSTLSQSFSVDFRFIFFFYFCFSHTYVTVIRFQLCCASPSFVPAASFSIKS